MIQNTSQRGCHGFVGGADPSSTYTNESLLDKGIALRKSTYLDLIYRIIIYLISVAFMDYFKLYSILLTEHYSNFYFYLIFYTTYFSYSIALT